MYLRLLKKDQTTGKEYYYLYNGHGDVVQIIDTNGNVVNNYVYDEWRNILSQTEGIDNSLKYSGQMLDKETGLYYLKARYYDPSVGRFINEDSFEGKITNPLNLNLYAYCEDNPLKYADPNGHSPIDTVRDLNLKAGIFVWSHTLFWVEYINYRISDALSNFEQKLFDKGEQLFNKIFKGAVSGASSGKVFCFAYKICRNRYDCGIFYAAFTILLLYHRSFSSLDCSIRVPRLKPLLLCLHL